MVRVRDENYGFKEVEKPKNRLKIAFVGKSKESNTYCARYLWKSYKFRFWGMDDELDKFLRRLHNSKYTFRPKMNYQHKLRYYDAWYKLDPDIWIRHILYRINEGRATRNAVVPDARYLNEIKALQEDGFVIIRVSVPDKFYSKKSTSIKMLNDTVNPGAIDYYEWFSPHVNSIIKADYSIHIDSFASLRRSIDKIISDLTDGELLPYTFQNRTDVLDSTGEENGEEKVSTLNENLHRRDE